jgi:uncharacterized C2H2 Zn-finger protein
MFKEHQAKLAIGDGVEELKCPWCGINFQNAKELDNHARNHYCKEITA